MLAFLALCLITIYSLFSPQNHCRWLYYIMFDTDKKTYVILKNNKMTMSEPMTQWKNVTDTMVDGTSVRLPLIVSMYLLPSFPNIIMSSPSQFLPNWQVSNMVLIYFPRS